MTEKYTLPKKKYRGEFSEYSDCTQDS